jgi:uncharacterized damage-inducible protein DinB
MNNPHSKLEISTTLNQQKLELQKLLLSIDPEKFFDGSSEHWSVAHHLQHLTSAIGRVAGGLANPSVLPAREPSASKTFEDLKQSYLSALASTPSEKLSAMGSRVTLEEYENPQAYKTQMISTIDAAIVNFNTALENFPESQLEESGMPHPLLGLISSREMVFFTVYHNTHHRDRILRLLE